MANRRESSRRTLLGCASLTVLAWAGCTGPQSALDPSGREADQIARLFWWMMGGAVTVWLAVIALAFYAIRARTRADDRRTRLMIVGGGAIFPTIVLGILLVYGLAMLPAMVARAPQGSLKIEVFGELWWWRVRYPKPGGGSIELANEIRLPVDEPVEFHLTSSNVIHSFWIPSLGGKRDMIPGRVTRLVLHPTRTGIFRGSCAEYCGTSHALMSFYVQVMEKDEFARWLEQQAQMAQAPATPLAARGQEQFLANGCNACHTIRGTLAAGAIGPDLTHVGNRLSLGAGILPNEPKDFRRWIVHTANVKPGVYMPEFRMLPADDVEAIAIYLEGLK